MVGITSQVIDSSTGKAATDVAVTLEFHVGHGEWREIGTGITNAHGVVNSLIAKNNRPEVGRYRMTYQTSSYFMGQGHKAFHPYIIVVFEIVDSAENYHVPLYVSPFGYTTVKGIPG